MRVTQLLNIYMYVYIITNNITITHLEFGFS